MPEATQRIEKLRHLLEEGILSLCPKATIIGMKEKRLCNTTCVSFSWVLWGDPGDCA